MSLIDQEIRLQLKKYQNPPLRHLTNVSYFRKTRFLVILCRNQPLNNWADNYKALSEG